MNNVTHKIILLIAVAGILSTGFSNALLPQCFRLPVETFLTKSQSASNAPCEAVCCSSRGTRSCHPAEQGNTASQEPERKTHCSGLCPCCNHLPGKAPFLPGTSSDSVRRVPQIAGLTLNASFDAAMSKAVRPYPNYSSTSSACPIPVVHCALLC